MSDEQKKDEEGAIYRVDTVPPPAGQDDAYSAPTKVGPMADMALKDMLKAAEARAQELNQKAAEKAKAVSARQAEVEPIEKPPVPPTPSKVESDAAPVSSSQPQVDGEVPRIYDDADEDNAATLLHRNAKPPVASVVRAPPPPPEPEAQEPVVSPFSAPPSSAPSGTLPAISPAQATSSTPAFAAYLIPIALVCSLVFLVGLLMFLLSR